MFSKCRSSHNSKHGTEETATNRIACLLSLRSAPRGLTPKLSCPGGTQSAQLKRVKLIGCTAKQLEEGRAPRLLKQRKARKFMGARNYDPTSSFPRILSVLWCYIIIHCRCELLDFTRQRECRLGDLLPRSYTRRSERPWRTNA
jgi:hypothetical protein